MEGNVLSTYWSQYFNRTAFTEYDFLKNMDQELNISKRFLHFLLVPQQEIDSIVILFGT